MPRPETPARRLLAAAVIAAALAAAGTLRAGPLPPEQAFQFSARLVDARTVEAHFMIADGYYLYRDRIHFSVEPAGAGLAVPQLPHGTVKEDPFFGRMETYRGEVVVKLALKDPKPGEKIVIAAESQGCADIGICYPATVQRVPLALPPVVGAPSRPRPEPTSIN